MSDFLKTFFKTPILVVFLVVSILFGVPALSRQSQIDEYAVSIGVGIDVAENPEKKYEVSFLTFIPVPNQNFSETYKVLSVDGDSVAEAVNGIGLYFGRKLRLAHIKTIILNQELLNEDVASLFDFLGRENDISASTKIVVVEGKAKEFLEIVQKIDSESAIKASQILAFNSQELYATDTTLEDFFDGYLGPTKVSLMPLFKLDESGEKGISSTEGGASGSGTASNKSQGESASKSIENSGESAIVKNGKFVTMISREQVKNINLLCGNFSTGFFSLKNFSGNSYKNSDLTFEVFGNKLKKRVSFENGIPIVNISLEVDAVLSEVVGQNIVEKNTNFIKLSREDLDVVENYLKANLADAVKVMRDFNVDIADYYTTIASADYFKFQKFLKQFDNNDNYLDNIIIKADVKLKMR